MANATGCAVREAIARRRQQRNECVLRPTSHRKRRRITGAIGGFDGSGTFRIPSYAGARNVKSTPRGICGSPIWRNKVFRIRKDAKDLKREFTRRLTWPSTRTASVTRWQERSITVLDIDMNVLSNSIALGGTQLSPFGSNQPALSRHRRRPGKAFSSPMKAANG
jgi:hypothetical protein